MHTIAMHLSGKTGKRLLCCFLLLVLLFVLAGCNSERPSYDGMYYRDAEGEIIQDKDVTLDVVAQAECGEEFNSIGSVGKRQQVIKVYLTYHLPAGADSQKLIELVYKTSITGPNLPSDADNNLSLIDGFLSEASTCLTLAEHYAEIKDDDAFGDFIDELGEGSKVVETVTKISKACLLISDLSNNDISNKEEYCEDLIDALSFITGHVPVLGDYFESGLEVVKEGVGILLKHTEIHENTLAAYGDNIQRGTFFSRITGTANFAFIVDETKWEFDYAPSVAHIFRYADEFEDMTSNEHKYLREYLLFRIPYELANSDKRGPEYLAEPSNPLCPNGHDWKFTDTWEATCEEDGEQVMSCIVCGYEQSTPIKAKGHNYSTVVTDPTCTEGGYTTYTCSECGQTKTDDETEVLPHDYEDTVVAPTYDAQGYTLHTCKNCGDSYQDTFVDPLTVSLPDLSQGATWYGYSDEALETKIKRFDLRVDEMTASYISGHFEISKMYNMVHETDVEGSGEILKDGTIRYTFTYAEPYVQEFFGAVYEETGIALIYDPKTDTMTFDGDYNADLHRITDAPPVILAENRTWAGAGECSFCYSRTEDHWFVIEVYRMTETDIRGKLTVSKDGEVEHTSEFTGRGYRDEKWMYFEVDLDTPRMEEKDFVDVDIDVFVLYYEWETDTLRSGHFEAYDYTLSPE